MKTLDELGVSKTPWSVEDDYWYIDAADGTPVANVGKYDCAEADARLIASAPMLYEALREAVIESCHDCPAYKNGKCESSVENACFVQRWYAALASASGESGDGEAK